MRVLVVGAGIGGLVAAVKLAQAGLDVTVLEQCGTSGGKMREVRIEGAAIDVGPTVLTMRWVFDELFERCGTSLETFVGLEPLEVLARHTWSSGDQLDLFRDFERTVEAIGVFAGAREALGYRRFSCRAQQIYETLAEPFMGRACPGPLTLARGVGLRKLPDLWRIAPFTTLHDALCSYFRDPRLIQLFGRYATYCGSSPYLAPATLMLIAHVERLGVWAVKGGMHGLANALQKLGEAHGVSYRYEAQVRNIDISASQVGGVTLADGESIPTDAVVLNADAAALGDGCFGAAAAQAASRVNQKERSLSALTWASVATALGSTLAHHNVFFSDDYRREFDQLFGERQVPHEPTVYLCAQDRGNLAPPTDPSRERLFFLINAPATGDSRSVNAQEFALCQDQIPRILKRYGLSISGLTSEYHQATPREFNRLFPGTGGALYGLASHGWTSSFRRPGARTKIRGLYLTGGSTHPGPGVPMAALSGKIAAKALLEDRASIERSASIAMRGGTSTR